MPPAGGAGWRGSHHDLAMQPRDRRDASPATSRMPGSATPASPRPSRAGTASSWCGPTAPTARCTTTTSSTRSASAPLQQYLIEFPDGRLQALVHRLGHAPAGAGRAALVPPLPGQNVTHRRRAALDGPEPELELHVRRVPLDGRPEELRRRRRGASPPATPRSTSPARPATGPARITSRGPGRRATGSASTPGRRGSSSALDDRRGVTWTISADTGNAQRTPPGRPAREVEMCGRCHARRGQFSDDYVHGRPLGDTHRVALLEDRLYHPDGQIRDEVYEYGSFLQSKMFHRGVTCSDCHDPHSLKLRAPGYQVCLGCHAAHKYAAPTHHFHQPGSRGADCIGCHMPTTTYMVVDPRHDHSLRVPRPDLSVKLGVPNACTRCHAGRPGRVGGQAEWRPGTGTTPRGYQRYGEALGRPRSAVRARRAAAGRRPRRRPAGHRAGERAPAPRSVAGPGGPRGRPHGARRTATRWCGARR